MQSEVMLLNLQQGDSVCPQGYILVLDQNGATNGSAACSFCKPGTYSINPLAGPTTGTPACFVCPAGGDCTKGGADVQFNKNGSWAVMRGEYVLTSCPAGYQLINSTAGTSKGVFSSTLQQCRACLPGQYIVNPNTDECQQCPPGITGSPS